MAYVYSMKSHFKTCWALALGKYCGWFLCETYFIVKYIKMVLLRKAYLSHLFTKQIFNVIKPILKSKIIFKQRAFTWIPSHHHHLLSLKTLSCFHRQNFSIQAFFSLSLLSFAHHSSWCKEIQAHYQLKANQRQLLLFQTMLITNAKTVQDDSKPTVLDVAIRTIIDQQEK